jgi:hypothetical protein
MAQFHAIVGWSVFVFAAAEGVTGFKAWFDIFFCSTIAFLPDWYCSKDPSTFRLVELFSIFPPAS